MAEVAFAGTEFAFKALKFAYSAAQAGEAIAVQVRLINRIQEDLTHTIDCYKAISESDLPFDIVREWIWQLIHTTRTELEALDTFVDKHKETVEYSQCPDDESMSRTVLKKAAQKLRVCYGNGKWVLLDAETFEARTKGLPYVNTRLMTAITALHTIIIDNKITTGIVRNRGPMAPRRKAWQLAPRLANVGYPDDRSHVEGDADATSFDDTDADTLNEALNLEG